MEKISPLRQQLIRWWLLHIRWFWLISGHLFLVVGIVGIFVPLLPTTPFLLLASFCYSKGSSKFAAWLLNHPRLGPPVRNWQEHGVISKRAKGLAAATIALSIGIVMTQASIPLAAKLAMLATVLPALAFILSRPQAP